jgi:aldehyde dehydrogenase (NAD+)
VSMTLDTPTFRSILLDLLGPAPEKMPRLDTSTVEGVDRLLIDGEMVPAQGGRTFDVRDPSSGDVIGVAADASGDDMEQAIAAARHAFDSSQWSHDVELRLRCLRQFQEALRRHAERIRVALVSEIGCAVRMTYGDQLDKPLEKLGFYIDLAARYGFEKPVEGGEEGQYLFYEPVGVVGAITPWNLPIELALAKVGAALASGNTAVLKPSPESPWSGALLGLAWAETEAPGGVLNVVTSADHALGAALTVDPRVDAIAFTGSTATGKRVMSSAAEQVKRVSLELGGKSPNVVLDDADLPMVLPLAAAFACFNAGQSCILPSRLLVPRDHLADCVDLAAEGMNAVPVGDPRDPDVFMGPLVSEAQRGRVESYIATGRKEGARLVVGGGRPSVPAHGYYVEPTLFADVDPNSTIAREEIFGPVLSLIAYDDEYDAVRLANKTDYGLAAYVWSSDREHGLAVARRIRTGMVAVNGGSFIGGAMPFGGRKQSGHGREWGVAGFEEFLELKSVGVGTVGTD